MGHQFLFSVDHFVQHGFHDHKALIIMLVTGLVAGLLAQMILPGRGFGLLPTIVIGCVGAWLGDKYIKVYLTFIRDPLFKHIAAATIGAMILALLINMVRGGHDRDKSHWRHG